MKNKSGFTLVVIFAIIAATLLVGGGYAVLKNKLEAPQLPIKNQPAVQPPQTPPLQTYPPSTSAVVAEIDKLTNWKTYKNNNYGFKLKYPAEFSAVFSDWRWGEMDVHFMTAPHSEDSVGIHVVAESLNSNNCLHFLCEGLVKDKLTFNNINWEYLGLQKYCDVGQCSPEQSVFRTIYKNYRYYVFFDRYDQEREILQTFKFIVEEATDPAVIVLSPNGNETWETGKSYKISWQTKNVPDPENWRYKVMFTKGYKMEILNKPFTETPDFLNWTVPDDFLVGNYEIQVEISNHSSGGGELYSDISDNQFKIIASLITPKVTIVSPNGGERWQMGSAKTIKWTSNNLSLNAYINIGLKRGDPDAAKDPFSNQIIKSTYNTGSTTWIVPTNLTPSKNYKIDIMEGNFLEPFQPDVSDAPFEIFR